MKEINELQAVATRLQVMYNYIADAKVATALNHLNKAIELLQESEKRDFDTGGVARGGYVKNGKFHKYRALIPNADEWIKGKTEFMQTFCGCKTLLVKDGREMKLHAYRKAQGRKKEIEITFILTLV